MEIKKEEIEDYIKNNLYFLCNQEGYNNDTEIIKELEREKSELLDQNSIVVEYKFISSKKYNIIKISFQKKYIKYDFEVGEELDNIYDNSNEKKVLNKNPRFSRYLIFKYLEKKVDKNKIQNLIEKIKEKIEHEVEEYIKNKKNKKLKINKYKQKIYYGVPGCGKSYRIKKEIEEVMESEKDKNNRVFRVTVHPDYSYSDFVGSIMPKVRDGKINFKYQIYLQ